MRKDIHTYMHMHKNTFKTFWVLVVVALRHVNYFDLRQKSSPVLGHNCAACRHKTGKPLHYESVVGNFFVYPKTCSIHVLQLSWPENTSKKNAAFPVKKMLLQGKSKFTAFFAKCFLDNSRFCIAKNYGGDAPNMKGWVEEKNGVSAIGHGEEVAVLVGNTSNTMG